MVKQYIAFVVLSCDDDDDGLRLFTNIICNFITSTNNFDSITSGHERTPTDNRLYKSFDLPPASQLLSRSF